MKKYLIAMLVLTAVCKASTSTSNDVYSLEESAWSPCSGNIHCSGKLQIIVHYTPRRYRLSISLLGMQCADASSNKYQVISHTFAESTDPTFSVSSWVEFDKIIAAGSAPDYTAHLTYSFENGNFSGLTVEETCK